MIHRAEAIKHQSVFFLLWINKKRTVINAIIISCLVFTYHYENNIVTIKLPGCLALFTSSCQRHGFSAYPLNAAEEDVCVLWKDGESGSRPVCVSCQQLGAASIVQHVCLSGDTADQTCHRQGDFTVDFDGSGVSAEASGHLVGLEPDRAAVQTHAEPGASVRHGCINKYMQTHKHHDIICAQVSWCNTWWFPIKSSACACCLSLITYISYHH